MRTREKKSAPNIVLGSIFVYLYHSPPYIPLFFYTVHSNGFERNFMMGFLRKRFLNKCRERKKLGSQRTLDAKAQTVSRVTNMALGCATEKVESIFIIIMISDKLHSNLLVDSVGWTRTCGKMVETPSSLWPLKT